VFHPDLVGIQVRVPAALGSNHVMVVYGKDGMDRVARRGDDGRRAQDGAVRE
jgi:anthranilate phosphoribosyltransferase